MRHEIPLDALLTLIPERIGKTNAVSDGVVEALGAVVVVVGLAERGQDG